MKLHWICLLVALLLSVMAAPSEAKNFVYKGTFTSTDLVSGQVQVLSLYFVLGDEEPIDSTKDTYAFISAVPVFFGGALGKKHYAANRAILFRTLELTETVKGKPRTVEIISQVDEAFPTNTGDGEHKGRVLVLRGVHTSPKYDTPRILTGFGVVTIGRVSSTPPSGSASRESLQLSLVTALTDSIPVDETLADSVKRVTNFLDSRGFSPAAP